MISKTGARDGQFSVVDISTATARLESLMSETGRAARWRRELSK
jgi:hypothetical protein